MYTDKYGYKYQLLEQRDGVVILEQIGSRDRVTVSQHVFISKFEGL